MPKIIEHKGQTHQISFWCPGCDCSMTVDPVRWNWNGDIEKPTLSPSILQTGGPFPDCHKDICHCVVTDGVIEFGSDCTHRLSGKKAMLPDWNDMVNLTIESDGRVWWTRKDNPPAPVLLPQEKCH